MRVSERIRKLIDAMPEGASVTLNVDTLRNWIGEDGAGFQPDLTVKEVAELFGRSPARVRAWIRDEQLRAYRFQNKEWRIPLDALKEFQGKQKGLGLNSNTHSNKHS